MKKLLSFALVLCLLSALVPIGVGAYDVVLSPQDLSVDGLLYECEKYNIDGSNYFKLRDLAYLLRETPAAFSVSWDAAANAVIIAPGFPYEPIGGELEISADKSGTAVPSAQTVWFLDAPVTDLSVYNIGGNNFFKLRELGELLGFGVDYDEPTDTAIVLSGADVLTSIEGRAAAFDAIWSWLQDNSTDVIDGGKAVLMRNASWDKGDVGSFWLIGTETEGKPELVLMADYTLADMATVTTRFFLARDSQRSLVAFTQSQPGNPGDSPKAIGSLHVLPSVFDADRSLTFEVLSAPLAEEDDFPLLAQNVTYAVADLLLIFEMFLLDTSALSVAASIQDFGFTRDQLVSE